MTLEPSRQPPPMIGELTLSAEGSPVRTFQQLGIGQASRESEAVCGRSSSESFAHFSHESSSWKTWQRSLTGELTEFSETWPESGSMRNGMCYRLVISVPTMKEPGYLSLPTPRHADFKGAIRPSKTTAARVKNGIANLPEYIQELERATGGGKINPDYSERLMGFPTSWTVLSPSATPLSPKSPNGSASES